MAKSNALGGGGRFAKLKGKLKHEGKSDEAAGAIAAEAGRKKYGKKAMRKMAARGMKRKAAGR